LETIKRLHQRHQVHYVCFDDPSQGPEGLKRANEYSSAYFTVPHKAPEKKLTSPAFLAQILNGVTSSVPVAVSRLVSPAMKQKVQELEAKHRYDAIVCDFLFPALNIPDLSSCVLFQHNVEALIWKRQAEHAKGIRRPYFQKQAERMEMFESQICRTVKRVIAVSESDVQIMRDRYGVKHCEAVPTGVDLEYFCPPAESQAKADIVFVGSMDWMPNQDGMRWFMSDVWALIQAKRPETTLAIVGRLPTPEIQAMAGDKIQVTGTVPEVRSWFWGSKVSVVPLRIGGGTRLKIYEAMAAKIPVVSTATGAEGLEIHNGSNIYIADEAGAFAARCLELLESREKRHSMADEAWRMVSSRYSWDSVTTYFERLLQ
jgi:glycosyltransferase involved in cell wall biosynthesis